VKPEEWREELKLHGELLEKRLEGHAPAELMTRYQELKATFA